MPNSCFLLWSCFVFIAVLHHFMHMFSLCLLPGNHSANATEGLHCQGCHKPAGTGHMVLFSKSQDRSLQDRIDKDSWAIPKKGSDHYPKMRMCAICVAAEFQFPQYQSPLLVCQEQGDLNPLMLSVSHCTGVSNAEVRQPGKSPGFSMNWIVGIADLEVINTTTGKRNCGSCSRLCKHMFYTRWAKLYGKVRISPLEGVPSCILLHTTLNEHTDLDLIRPFCFEELLIVELVWILICVYFSHPECFND